MLIAALGAAAWGAFHYWKVKARFDQLAESQRCVNQMCSLGIAGKWWAGDNDGRFPSNWQCMSNEVSYPGFLICPGDRERRLASNWSTLTDADSSYQIVSPGITEAETNAVFLRCTVHGYICYTTGIIFDGTRTRTKFP